MKQVVINSIFFFVRQVPNMLRYIPKIVDMLPVFVQFALTVLGITSNYIHISFLDSLIFLKAKLKYLSYIQGDP